MTDERRTESRPAPGVITIRNWKRFQHYKYRSPPWVRLYRSLLEQDWYRALSDNAARWLIELWLLASRDHGKVPYDTLMILRDVRRPTSDKPLLDGALQELASADAITVAGTDASAEFIASLAHRVSEVQRDRVSVATQPAKPAAQDNHGKMLGLIREHLWKPDGKCPAIVAEKPWTEAQEVTVIRELRKSYSVSDVECLIIGLGNMVRGLAESERPEWLEIGSKVSLRAIYRTRSGVAQMAELCRRAYWSVENKRGTKKVLRGVAPIGDVLENLA